MTNQPLAVFAKAREAIASRLRQATPPAPTDIKTAAAEFYAQRSMLPGAAAVCPTTVQRAALEAAAFVRGLDTNPNESDRLLACRITGRAAATVADDDETCIAAAFAFVAGGAS